MKSTLVEQPVGQLITERRVRSVYQPIVELASGKTVGFEALARGPAGSGLEMPGKLFPAASAAGLRTELERACLTAAFAGVSGLGFTEGVGLFVNLEPGLIEEAEVERLLRVRDLLAGRVSVFIELTERDLTDAPTTLLRSVDRMREAGFRIALDDVGADSGSLALIPFLEPEVIKLDLRLIHGRPRVDAAETIHAVCAEAERSGALIVAEGIESEAHMRRALALGAQLGQGWMLGRPSELDQDAVEGARAVPPLNRARPLIDARTPFEIVSAERATRFGDKRLLLSLSKVLEAEAGGHGVATVLMSTFQASSFFTPLVADRYADLAAKLPLVGALGQGIDPGMAPGVRWGEIASGDPLCEEWDVSVIGPHFAAAFVARDLGDTGPDMDRSFEFVLTYERGLAVRAARSMMRRLAATSPAPVQPS